MNCCQRSQSDLVVLQNMVNNHTIGKSGNGHDMKAFRFPKQHQCRPQPGRSGSFSINSLSRDWDNKLLGGRKNNNRRTVGKSQSFNLHDVHIRKVEDEIFCTVRLSVQNEDDKEDVEEEVTEVIEEEGKSNDEIIITERKATLSPKKPTRSDSLRIEELAVVKRSPVAVDEFSTRSSFIRAANGGGESTTSKFSVSISSLERSVLQQFPGFDASSQTLHVSAEFLDFGVEKSLNGSSSFITDCNSSIPVMFGESRSNFSEPSEITTASSYTMEDYNPQPPTRGTRPKLLKSTDSSPLVSSSMYSLDMSPMKPTRQGSVRQLPGITRALSTATTVMSESIDSSPKRPERMLSSRALINDGNSSFGSIKDNCSISLSTDSLPVQPKRQGSSRNIMRNGSSVMIQRPRMRARSSFANRSRRMNRFELTRQDSIIEEELEFMTGAD